MRARPWLAIVGAVVAVPATAVGHSALRSTGPTGDGGARLVFSAPVERAFLRVAAVGPAGTRPLGAAVDPSDDQAVLVSAIARPARLEWRVMSRDGHVSEGTAAIAQGGTATVSGGARRDDAAAIVADALIFAGLLGLVGLACLRFTILAPAWRSGGPRAPGGGDPDEWRRATEPSIRRALGIWWRAWWALVALAAAGLAIGPVTLVRELGEGAGSLGTLLGDTPWGRAWWAQLAGLAGAAGAAAGLQRRRDVARAPDPSSAWGWWLGVPAGVGAVAIAWAGHASSGTDAGLGVAVDAAHLLATGAWLGGLLGLLAIVPPVRRTLDEASSTRLVAGIVVRFSALAIACVATLVVTGVYRALAELRSFGDLLDTGYGQALLVKLVMFAVLLVGGAVNRLVLHPRLERAALGLRDGDGGAGHQLRVSVTAELVLATALLVVVAVLVGLPPP